MPTCLNDAVHAWALAVVCRSAGCLGDLGDLRMQRRGRQASHQQCWRALSARGVSHACGVQAEDLVTHHPERYKEPNKRELEQLDEGDLIMIAFINKEDIW